MAHRTEGQRGKKGRGSGKLPQRSCAAFLLLRSVLLRTGADDSHIGLPRKKNEIDPGTQRPDGSWQRSEWCCLQMARETSGHGVGT